MKKIFLILSALISISAISQRTSIRSGWDPANPLKPGYKFYDTTKTPVGIFPIIYDGDSTFSLGLVPVSKGGTGKTSYTVGAILYASSSGVLGEIPVGTNGQILQMVAGVPTWVTAVSGGASQWTTSGSDIYYNTGNVAIGNTPTTGGSGILELISTTKGFIPPRMTTTQRDAIVSPVAGLQVYNTTSSTYDLYTGASWASFQTSANGVLTTTDQTITGIKSFYGNGSGAAIQLGSNMAIRGTASTGGAIYIDANQAQDNTGTINLRGNVAISGATTFSSTISATSFTATGGGASYTVGVNGAIRGLSSTNGTIYMDASQDLTGTFNYRATTVNMPNVFATKYNVSALNSAPASATATGTLGEIRWTSTAVYLCVATNTWVKAALATF